MYKQTNRFNTPGFLFAKHANDPSKLTNHVVAW